MNIEPAWSDSRALTQLELLAIVAALGLLGQPPSRRPIARLPAPRPATITFFLARRFWGPAIMFDYNQIDDSFDWKTAGTIAPATLP
jgi:hypothetical protein